MTSVSICSSFYESGRPYMDACLQSVLEAVASTDCQANVLVAVDDLEQPQETLRTYQSDIQVSWVDTPPGASISGVRNALFDLAKTSGSEHLIFLDMDDVLARNGIDLHLEALAKADISYGDMTLIDSQGQPMAGTLYAGADIPDQVRSVESILRKNFFGLSNTAVRRAVLDSTTMHVPEHLVATDWWFYTTLLLNGCTACKTSGPVGAYRQHQGNVLGSNPAADVMALRKRCKIVREHFAALPQIPEAHSLDAQVAGVEKAIENDPDGVALFIEEAYRTPNAWFEEVFRIADQLGVSA